MRSARSRGRSAMPAPPLLYATLSRRNVGSGPAKRSPGPATLRPPAGWNDQLAAVPALGFLAVLVAVDAFGGAAGFGASVRMPPQGSLDALASGIFFRVSL